MGFRGEGMELRPYKRPDNPENRSWLGKQMTPGKITRSLAVLAACAAIGSEIYSHLAGESKKTLDAMAEVAAAPEDKEAIDQTEILPEDERSGDNILIAAHPDGHFAQHRKEGAYKQYFENNFKSILDVLPAGTNVHVVVPENSREEALKVATEMFPKLSFVIYGLPYNLNGILYGQDTFFIMGSFDQKGRPVLATSTIDREWLEKAIIAGGKAQSKIAYLIPSHESNERIEYGMNVYGDDLLAKLYSDRFSAKKVPVRTEGGDLQFSRMPDGKIALIVGRKNLAETIMFGLKETAGATEQQTKGVGIGEIIPYIEQARDLYKKSFPEVAEVIFLGEDEYVPLAGEESRRKRAAEDKYVPYRNSPNFEEMVSSQSKISAVPRFFFHEDMMLKTVTTPDGRHVALSTEYTEERMMEYLDTLAPKIEADNPGYNPEMNEEREYYESLLRIERTFLAKIQTQFSKLGYEIKTLPCGANPVMNYTNSVVFKGEGKNKVAMVPQYGIPEDKQALEVYRSLGFKVLPVDYTPSINAAISMTESYLRQIMVVLGLSPEGGLEKTGGIHCRVVVLGNAKKDFYTPPKINEEDYPIPYVKPADRKQPPKFMGPRHGWKGGKGGQQKPAPVRNYKKHLR
jgi:hypothetical protein